MATAEIEVDAKLRKVLDKWRRAQARRDKVTFTRVLTDAGLDELSAKKPVCDPDVLAMKCMSLTKFRKYGSKISDLIRKFKISTATSTLTALKLAKEKIPQYLRIHSALLGWKQCRKEAGRLQGTTLRFIAAQAPTTMSSLAEVRGIGQAFLGRHGDEIIRIVQNHLTNMPLRINTASSQETTTQTVRSPPRRSLRLQEHTENSEPNSQLSATETTTQTVRSPPRRSLRLQEHTENSEPNSQLSASGESPSQVTPIQIPAARQAHRNHTTSSEDDTRQTIRNSPRRSARLHSHNSGNSTSSNNRSASDNTPTPITPLQVTPRHAARMSPRRSRRLQVQNAEGHDESDDSDEVIYIETRTSSQMNVLDDEIVIVEDLNNSDVISRRIQDAENNGDLVYLY